MDEKIKLELDNNMHVVVLSPEVAEANLDVLRGMSAYDSTWLAIVQVAVVLRDKLLRQAMAGNGDLVSVNKAAGVGLLLSELDRVRRGGDGEGQV